MSWLDEEQGEKVEEIEAEDMPKIEDKLSVSKVAV